MPRHMPSAKAKDIQVEFKSERSKLLVVMKNTPTKAVNPVGYLLSGADLSS